MTERKSRIGRPTPEMPVVDPSSPAEAPEAEVPAAEPTPEVEPQARPQTPYRDVLELPAYLLNQKPMLPTALRCRLFGVDFVITTSRKAYDQAIADALPVFTGAELEALALAAQNERAWPATMFGWLDRKRAQPGWRLTKNDALGEYYPSEASRRLRADWTIGRVFVRLGVSLLGVEMEG